jgi:predicted hydrocarbon binding protein
MFIMINILRKVGVFPSKINNIGDMQRIWRLFQFPYGLGAKLERCGRVEYIRDQSKSDEYTFRIYENFDCWGLDGVGSKLASYLPPSMAGQLMGLESVDREWNAIETKCIGLGQPYCEVKLVPGEADNLKNTLAKDAEAVSTIHHRLVEKFASHILDGNPLTDRPASGPDVHLHPAFHTFGFPRIAGDRSRMAIRMGGAKTGKEIAERLRTVGLKGDEVIQRVFSSMRTLKVGVISTPDGKIRIEENIEPLYTKYMTHLQEPSCFFTTGFLNGLYNATLGLRVKETKCFADGDTCCEWGIL